MQLDMSTADTAASVHQITTDSLGDHSYIIVVDGHAAAIDIQRDLERFDAVLDGIDASLVAVLETHIHNDYVSGGKRLADAHGAAYVLPAETEARYEHLPLRDGQSIDVGPWLLRAMHTPGHTFHHTSYVLEAPHGPVAVFTGGSMLVGAVGRSDLLGPEHTETLLRHQFASVHRLADELPDPSVVAPTHGTGSFCSASAVADTTSTIERERSQNPALVAPSVEAFGMGQVIGYRRYPAYYAHMGPANLVPLGAPPDAPLPTISEVDEVEGAVIVDVRPFAAWAAGHIPGSINVPASDDDAVYLGWTLPWNEPIVLVGSPAEASDVRTHLARIGWDRVVGRIDPSLLSEVPLATTRSARFADLDDVAGALIDVRDPVEHRGGVLPGATAIHLADYAANPGVVPGDAVVIHCEGGYRAAIAAGFAEAAGRSVTVVYDELREYRGELVAPSA